jgi:hypothetical protein
MSTERLLAVGWCDLFCRATNAGMMRNAEVNSLIWFYLIVSIPPAKSLLQLFVLRLAPISLDVP